MAEVSFALFQRKRSIFFPPASYHNQLCDVCAQMFSRLPTRHTESPCAHNPGMGILKASTNSAKKREVPEPSPETSPEVT